MYRESSNRCVKYVSKMFQTKVMKNEEIVGFFYFSWKRAFCFNKKAPVFDKKALR